MAKNTSFEIEDAEKLLNQLQKLNEIFQQDWSKVLNQWANIKATWQDKQFVVFEAKFQELLSIYQRSEKECEEYILEIKQQIEMERELTNIRFNLAQTSIRRDQLSTSSPTSKDGQQIPQPPEIKNTSLPTNQNDIEGKQMLNDSSAQQEDLNHKFVKSNLDYKAPTRQQIPQQSVIENNSYSPVDNPVVQEQQSNLYSTQRDHFNKKSPLEQSYSESSREGKILKTQPGSKKETNSAVMADNIPEANSSKTSSKNANNLPENWTQMQEIVQTQLAVLDDIKRNASSNGTNIQRWEIPTEITQGQLEHQYIYVPISSIQREQEAQFVNNNLNSNNCAADFITDPEKTLNLYNPPGIDSRAAAIAAYLIQDKNPEAMIYSIAKKQLNENKDDFLLRIETSTNANYDALSSEYFSYLNHLQSLPLEILQTILTVLGEKSTEIDKIAKMLEGVINLPKIIFNNCPIGNTTVSEQHGISFNIGGDLSGIVNLGQISGNVTNTVQQLPDSPDPEQPGIKELLTQIQEAINGETNMTDEEKVEALEQVQALAEAGQKPKEGNMHKQAKKATTMLRGMIAGLPAAAQLVEAFNTILPKLSSFFGF